MGKEEGFQAAMEELSARERGVDPETAELAKLRVWAPFTEARLENIQQILWEFQRQRREIETLLDTVHSGLQIVSTSENNVALIHKQRISELEDIEKAKKENKGE